MKIGKFKKKNNEIGLNGIYCLNFKNRSIIYKEDFYLQEFFFILKVVFSNVTLILFFYEIVHVI